MHAKQTPNNLNQRTPRARLYRILRRWCGAVAYAYAQMTTTNRFYCLLFYALVLLSVGQIQTASAQTFLTNGLLAYYPFNGNANDATGHGFNGTIHGATLVPDQLSRPNAAYHLNGSNAYIYFGPILPDMQTITVAAWAKSYGGGTFFADADWQVNNDFTLNLNSTNTAIRSDKPPAPVGFATNVPFGTDITGTWRHVAWVVTTNWMQVYLDGVPVQPRANAGGVDVGYHDFVIGTLEFPQGSLGWGGYWKGDVSQLRIYDRALSSAEIRQLYAYDSGPRVTLLELQNPAVIPLLINLSLGTNYQLQVSGDLKFWTNQGTVFTATNNSMLFPRYFDGPSELFFRLRVAP